MKQIKIKDLKEKLLAIICFIKQLSKYIILKDFKQQQILVTVFITEKLKQMKRIYLQADLLEHISEFNSKTIPKIRNQA